MPNNPIRWLHISDFHVGKENYAQLSMFQEILTEIENRVEQGFVPDLILLTGDIANHGKAKDYEQFEDNFFLPLLDKLGNGWDGKIYAVPGNHDVDRSKAEAVMKHGVLDNLPNFLDPDDIGLQKRKDLLPRFHEYTQHDSSTIEEKHWLTSSNGFYTESVIINGYCIGILGINTAWLSENDQDEKKLTPGIGIVKEGLSKFEDVDLVIVIGHHPINWFRPQDKSTIRSLLAKHTVVYLHGHLHEIGASPEYGTGDFFWSIQSGACFQVRPEDKILKNSILWCEIDLAKKNLMIEPIMWDDPSSEWKLDTKAFPNKFLQNNNGLLHYILPLEIPVETTSSVSKKEDVTTVERLKLPAGWMLVDQDFLKTHKKNLPLSEDDAIAFFDGRLPLWKYAISPDIPQRQIVNSVLLDFEDDSENNQPQIIKILGPGGEGKSTALRQIICRIIETKNWAVIWHNDPEARLSKDFCRNLPTREGCWVIASDDADLTAQNIYYQVKEAYEEGRNDIHFILCARLTDWFASKANILPWHKFKVVEYSLKGLIFEDALDIVKAWNGFGNKAMGKLSGKSIENAAEELQNEAKSLGSSSDGAFLGAMLRVRYGEALKEHIRELIGRLDKRKAPGGTLLKAFSYIVALHAENKFLLTKLILAKILNCSPREVTRKIIGPLGYEAAAEQTGRYILGRHRAISETAKEIIEENYFEDFDEIYIDIVKAAWELRVEGVTIHQIHEYANLSRYFSNKGDQDLGVRLAEAMVEANPTNPFLITRLSYLYRDINEADLAASVFRKIHPGTNVDRALYYEWGTAEGNLGNQAISASIDTVSLADGIENSPPDNEQTKLSLAGMGVAFQGLFEKYNDHLFLESRHAVGLAGLRLKLDGIAQSYFQRYKCETEAQGISLNAEEAIDKIIQGVNKAWSLHEIELPEFVPKVTGLTFDGLRYVLKMEAS